MSTDDPARGRSTMGERWVPDEDEFRAAALDLDALVREFEALPLPGLREKIFALLAAVDTVHRAGLVRLADFLHERGHGVLLDEAVNDPLIGGLLALYDLAPAPVAPVAPASDIGHPANGLATVPSP